MALGTRTIARDDRGLEQMATLYLSWDTLPPTLALNEYAWAMGVSTHQARRQAADGSCAVPPAFIRPYRWRKGEVQRHLLAGSGLERRQRGPECSQRRTEERT